MIKLFKSNPQIFEGELFLIWEYLVAISCNKSIVSQYDIIDYLDANGLRISKHVEIIRAICVNNGIPDITKIICFKRNAYDKDPDIKGTKEVIEIFNYPFDRIINPFISKK